MLHRDLTGDDLHVNKLHAATHLAGGTDPINLGNLQSQLNGVRPFAAPVITGSYDIPASIDATGTTDASTALINFIAGVPDGSLITFPSAGIYRIDKAIEFTSRHNLILDGNGCTLKYTSVTGTTEGYSLFRDLSSGSDIWIRNFVLIGSSPYPGVYTPGAWGSLIGGEWQHGVIIQSPRFEVSGCTISSVWGDGFTVFSGADNVWIHENTVTSAGRCGVAIINARNILVENNVFTTIGYVVCDNEPDLTTESVYNSVFRLNTVGTFGFAFFCSVGPKDALIDSISAESNVVTGGTLKTVVGTDCLSVISRVRFLNNTGMVAADGPVLVFRNVNGLTVNGNTQPLSSGILTDSGGSTGEDDSALLRSELQGQIDTKLTFARTNLVTNGDFEVNTSGWGGTTISRETDSPLIGTGSLKLTPTGASHLFVYWDMALIVGHTYYFAGLVKNTTTGGRRVQAYLEGHGGASVYGMYTDCTAGATLLSITFPATVNTGSPAFKLNGYTDGDYFLLASVVCYDLTAGTTATVAEINKLHSATAALQLSALNTAPANAGDTGTLGEIRITADAIYVCTATDTWVKAAIATWA